MEKRPRILAIVGSRYFVDYKIMCDILNQLHRDYNILDGVDEIVSGGAPGVDTLAEQYAIEHNLKMKAFIPGQGNFVYEAKKRNTQIVDYCTHMVALPGPKSKGTYDSINKAKKTNKICYIVKVDK
jgi:predicted Rossmann fold nucleotide-binding protein DprA/Smf involved in DNA uptake